MARPPSRERLGRILSMVPWIAEADGPLIEDVCERFGVSREDLLADLDVVLCTGIYPHTPGDYIDVDVDDTRVWINYTNFFDRPPRLTHTEALALLAAGVAATAQSDVTGSGALTRGVDKLAGALGIQIGEDLDVVVSEAEASTYAIVDRAVRDAEVLHITYFSHARNTETERDIEPLRLVTAEGAAYVDAFCRSTGDARLFRLDRITALSATGDHFDPDAHGSELGDEGDPAFRLGAELPRVTLELPPAHRWVLEHYPVEEVTDGDHGRFRVTLAVSARPWLERFLLLLGPEVIVIDAPSDLAAAGREAARRLLEGMR